MRVNYCYFQLRQTNKTKQNCFLNSTVKPSPPGAEPFSIEFKACPNSVVTKPLHLSTTSSSKFGNYIPSKNMQTLIMVPLSHPPGLVTGLTVICV